MEKENVVVFVRASGKPYEVLTEEAKERGRQLVNAVAKEVDTDSDLKLKVEDAAEQEFDEAACSQAVHPPASKRSLSPCTSTSRQVSSYKTPEPRKKLKTNGISSFKSPRPAEPRPAIVVPETPPAPLKSAISQSTSAKSCLSPLVESYIPCSPASAIARLQLASLLSLNLTAAEMEDIVSVSECNFSDNDSFGEDREPLSGTDMFTSTPEFEKLLDSSSKRPNLTETELADLEDITGTGFVGLFDDEF